MDNVRFGRPDARPTRTSSSRSTELGLLDWLDGLPHGLDTEVGQRGESLSAGERQLVALARAYLADPDLLVLDEATCAVDPATEVRLARALEGLTRGPYGGHHRAPALDRRGRRRVLVVRRRPDGRAWSARASWSPRAASTPAARVVGRPSSGALTGVDDGPRDDRAVTDSPLDPAIAARLKRDAAGLVAAVVQQHDTGEVLMVGWMDDEALHRTLTTGRATFWSRSRQEYWRKGDTSGHVQHVREVRARLRRRRAARRGRPGRRRPATPATRTCFDAGVLAGRGDAGRRPEREPHPTWRYGSTWPDLESFRELARDRRVIPVTRRLLADAETPLGRLPQAGRGPARHVPARVGRARRRLVALLLRRRPVARDADRARRRGALDRRAAGRRADRRRPAGGAARDGRGAAHRAPARPAAADRRPGRLPSATTRCGAGAAARH